MQRSTHQ